MTDAYTLAGSYASAAQNAAVEIVAGAFDSPTGNKAFLRTMLRRWATGRQKSTTPPEPPKPKTTYEFIVAFDVRTWTTFRAHDLTHEQVEMLESQAQSDTTAEALGLMRSLFESGRMSEVLTESDDAQDPFSEYSNPSIIDFEEVEAD